MRFYALMLLSVAACAQSFQPTRSQQNLSPAAVGKLNALHALTEMPGGNWRVHPGDLPHGEAVDLDDSKWTEVAAPHGRGTQLHDGKEAVWYRRRVTVPATLNGYDITGARVWFQFRADANGSVPEIIYFNGRRVALGEDLEPIVLFEPAHPGDSIVVAVKLLHTIDVKTVNGISLRVEPLDAARPNPEDVAAEAETAATLLPALPTPRKDLLPKVESAIAAVDVSALQRADQRAFDASLRKAQATLRELHDVLSATKITLAGNSHIDAAWLWPKSETVDVVHRTFSTALQLMNEYPDYTFTQSAAQYSSWMADKYPAMNAEIAERVKQGRWEIVGGMLVEPDLNLPGGESLVRQLLVGQREFQRLYGVTARIGWNPDSFGYNWQLPQIYKRSGMDYFVTQKMHWNDTNQLPFRLFWWESPDGSKVLTYFPTDYAWTNVNPQRLAADFAESATRNPGLADHLDLFGVGDHGGGPTRAMLDQADKWIAASKGGAAVASERYGTATPYFAQVEKTLSADSPVWNYDRIAKGYSLAPAADGKVAIPTWKDELYFEYHRGVYTTQAQHKRDMRHTELDTVQAETLASLAWLNGKSYPGAEFTESWKKIAFNQFHDLAAGSGIAVIYRDAQKEYEEVYHSDKLIDASSLETLVARIDTRATRGEGVPVVLVNTLPWARHETVEFDVQMPEKTSTIKVFSAKGELQTELLHRDDSTNSLRVRATVDVPGVGYSVIHVAPGDPSAKRLVALAEDSTDSFQIANSRATGRLNVTVNKKTGCVTALEEGDFVHQIYSARQSCGNQLQTWADNPKDYDAWNIDPGTLDAPMTPIDAVDSVQLVEDSSLRKTVRVERTWRSSHFVQDISVDAGSDVVRVVNDIDWNEKHTLLKVAFPLAHSSAKATFEIPFGTIERPTTRDNSFSKAQFEVPALKWADLGDGQQGVAILNDSKYGYDALGNTLRMTLLRGATWPDADADQGHHHFTYLIAPHSGPWQKSRIVQQAAELNTPLLTLQTFAHEGPLPSEHSFLHTDEPNLVISAVKKAEDSEALIVRVYDATGAGGTLHLHVPDAVTAVREVNLMEQPVTGTDAQLTGGVVTLSMQPWQIRTLQLSVRR